jgi:hypothetical protein
METSPTINSGVLSLPPVHREIDKRVLELPSNVLECRAGNHYFPIDLADQIRIREGGRDLYETKFTCPRCMMAREDVTDRYSDELIRRKYEPPEDYGPKEKGGGRIPRADARHELYRRRWPDD